MFWKLTSIPYEHASYTGLISGGKIISWERRQGKLNIYNLIISIYYIYNILSLKKKNEFSRRANVKSKYPRGFETRTLCFHSPFVDPVTYRTIVG